MARKSPSKEPDFDKVGSFDGRRCLQLRQDGLVEFCHLDLADPLPTRRRATIFSRLAVATISLPSILVLRYHWREETTNSIGKEGEKREENDAVADNETRENRRPKRAIWPKLACSVEQLPYNIGRADSSSFAIEASSGRGSRTVGRRFSRDATATAIISPPSILVLRYHWREETTNPNTERMAESWRTQHAMREKIVTRRGRFRQISLLRSSDYPTTQVGQTARVLPSRPHRPPTHGPSGDDFPVADSARSLDALPILFLLGWWSPLSNTNRRTRIVDSEMGRRREKIVARSLMGMGS